MVRVIRDISFASIILFPYAPFMCAEELNQVLSEVVSTLHRESYFPVKKDEAMIKALDAFSRSIDEHTRFLGPDEYQELLEATDGGYYGIGIECGPKKEDDQALLLVSIKPESPASHAGLQRYDKILAIDSIPVGPLSLDAALKKLRTQKSPSPVTLTIQRDTRTFEVTIQRDRLSTAATWCTYLPDQEILYCQISLFTQTVASSLRSLLQKGLGKKPRGIIIDLRDNPGGVLRSAIDCASLFLPQKSLIVSTKDRHGTLIESYRTTDAPLSTAQIPIIILVNQYTASASEILAQALCVHSKNMTTGVSPYVFTLGTQTYGKGSVQDLRPIGSHCALKVTTGLYYLPDSSCVQGKGVRPNFRVKQQYPESKETKLLHKLYGSETPRTQRKKSTPKKKDSHSLRIKALTNDYQVHCASEIIQLIDLGRIADPSAFTSHDKALNWLSKRITTPALCKPHVLEC